MRPFLNSNPLRDHPVIFAVGGGKGGVGKSLVTSNLALYLARKEHRTLLIDFDFGGANAHTYLELETPRYSAHDFFSKRVLNFQKLITPSHYSNLSFISGTSEWSENTKANLNLLNEFYTLAHSQPFDCIVYDLGAGTSVETLATYLMAQVKLTVCTPEPISIENTYNFLKKTFYQALKEIAEQHNFSNKVNLIMENKKELGLGSPSAFLKYIRKKYPLQGQAIQNQITKHRSYVVINQCRSPADPKIGTSLAQISRQFFGLPIEFLGSLSHANEVWQSTRSKKTLALTNPNSTILKELHHLFSQLETIENLSPERYSLIS